MTSEGHSLVAVCGLLTAVTSFVAGQGLQGTQALVAAVLGLSNCGTQALVALRRTDSSQTRD